jgi:hypothetical protein
MMDEYERRIRGVDFEDVRIVDREVEGGKRETVEDVAIMAGKQWWCLYTEKAHLG